MTGIVLVLGDDDANCMHRGWYIGTMTSNGPLAIVGMARNYLRASDLDMERCKDRQRKSTHPGHWRMVKILRGKAILVMEIMIHFSFSTDPYFLQRQHEGVPHLSFVRLDREFCLFRTPRVR